MMKSFFIALILFSYSSIQAENIEITPQIVLICGASCAGKSTLSHALAENLGDYWRVLDRDDLEENAASEEAIDQLLVEEIEKNLEKGFRVVVDTQTYQPLLEPLKQYSLFTIYVYTPLPILLARDSQRQQMRNRPEQRRRYARAFVLNTFVQLMTLSESETMNAVPIDFLKVVDIDADFDQYPIHEKTYHFLTQVSLCQQPQPIYAAIEHHMLIRGDSQTLSDSVYEIMEKIVSTSRN